MAAKNVGPPDKAWKNCRSPCPLKGKKIRYKCFFAKKFTNFFLRKIRPQNVSLWLNCDNFFPFTHHETPIRRISLEELGFPFHTFAVEPCTFFLAIFFPIFFLQFIYCVKYFLKGPKNNFTIFRGQKWILGNCGLEKLPTDSFLTILKEQNINIFWCPNHQFLWLSDFRLSKIPQSKLYA